MCADECRRTCRALSRNNNDFSKHFLQVDDDLFSRNRDLVRMSGTTRSMVNYHVDSSMGSTVRHYDQALALARTEMRKVAQRAADLPLPGTVMIIHGR